MFLTFLVTNKIINTPIFPPSLSFQAILFYTPRWLWKSWEGGKIHALIMDLDIGICSEAEKKQKKKLLLDYLWENLRYAIAHKIYYKTHLEQLT